MRFVARESAPALRDAETFTFECECGETHVVTMTRHWDRRVGGRHL